MSRSRTDAKTFVEKAAEFLRTSGRRIALAEFTRPDGAFVEDELYIFTLNARGTMLAHGVNERFVGEEFLGLQDSDGKFFIKEIVEGANVKGSGWVEYRWHHPITRKWLPKTVYYEKIEDLIICSGIYDHSG